MEYEFKQLNKEFITKIKKSNIEFESKESLLDLLQEYDLSLILEKKLRSRQSDILFRFEDFTVSYPIKARFYSQVLLIYQEKYIFSVIIGERVSQGYFAPIILEPDCCYTYFNELNDIFDHWKNGECSKIESLDEIPDEYLIEKSTIIRINNQNVN